MSGDYTVINRTLNSTDFILSDGLGSGLTANISAIACASRLMELINQDVSLQRVAEKAVELMRRARTESIPYATFTIVRIQRDGRFAIINYENPAPVFINSNSVQDLNLRHHIVQDSVLLECDGILSPGDSLILTSDGVSQAGLGILPGYGWGVEGLKTFIKRNIGRRRNLNDLGEDILKETYRLSGDVHADDTTIAILSARPAKLLNLLSGPPLSKESDIRFTMDYIKAPGKKVICGSSTADMVARVTGRELKTAKITGSFTKPPEYGIKGIDLVTEGAITLNQVYNILDEDPRTYDRDSCVSELALLLRNADEIKFFMGMAVNEGHTDIAFKQLGVLPRRKIIPLIADKLKAMDKLVSITTG